MNRYVIEFPGQEIRVQARVQDSLWVETKFRQHKAWGPLNENPVRMTTMIAYRAAQRLGHLPEDMDFDQFCDEALVVRPDAKPEPEEDEEGPLEVPGLGKDTP